MSDSHHADSDAGLIKTPTQLMVVIVLAFVIPIAGILGIIHFVVGGDKSRASAAMSDKAIAQRIAPVGSVPVNAIDKGTSPLVPAPAPVVVAAAGDAKAAAAPDGKSVYDAACQACHYTGVAGAPKLSDKAAWGPRLGAGAAALVTNAIKGKGSMPAKGGNLTLSDGDVKAAVDYMVSQAK